ncbi:MAG: hypothetical protein ABI594_03065 [Ginsengibacter sp.]
MKKILIAVTMFFACLSFANAQQAPAKTTAKKQTKMTATVKSTDKKGAPVTSATTKQEKVVKTNTTGLKKDGTKDMRMKENKVTTKTTTVAGPTKKDGTADMRYKANKKK